MHIPVLIWSTGLALILSVVGVRVAILVADRLRYHSVAGSEAHKVQTRNVPYGGGLGMAFAMAVALGLGWLFGGMTQIGGDVAADHGGLGGIVAGAVVLLLLGAWDDRRALPPVLKLLIQGLAAGLSVWGSDLAIDSLRPWPVLAYGLAGLWLILITNAFNLLDHADGLSASVSMVCACVILSGALMAGDIGLAMIFACLIASLAGFLVWNLPPARIYMGDAGALPLGYLIGCGTLAVTFWPSTAQAGSWLAIFTPLVITAIPLFDTLVVVLKRLRRGQPVMKGDRNHICHRLGRLGLSPLTALAVVVALQAALAASALQLRSGDLATGLIALAQNAAILVAVVLLETARDHG
jgi:UDP-GlcNAc:undecaprenyl-phosphate GlcNAc-1-phosphate transferase